MSDSGDFQIDGKQIRNGLIASLVIVLAVAMTGSAVECAAPTQSTMVVRIQPWQGTALKHPFRVDRRLRGKCLGRATESARLDAWRCETSEVVQFIARSGRASTAHAVLEPCFSPSVSKAVVVCIPNPFKDGVTLVELPAPLPAGVSSASPDEGARPWALRLANADTCLLQPGIGYLAGKRADYMCYTKGGIGGLIGVPDRTNSLWTIEYVPSYTSREMRRIGIAEAIF